MKEHHTECVSGEGPYLEAALEQGDRNVGPPRVLLHTLTHRRQRSRFIHPFNLHTPFENPSTPHTTLTHSLSLSLAPVLSLSLSLSLPLSLHETEFTSPTYVIAPSRTLSLVSILYIAYFKCSRRRPRPERVLRRTYVPLTLSLIRHCSRHIFFVVIIRLIHLQQL